MTNQITRTTDPAERVVFTDSTGTWIGEVIDTPAGLMVWGRDLGYDDDTNNIYLDCAEDLDHAVTLVEKHEWENDGELLKFDLHQTWNVPPEAIRHLASDLITTAVDGGINYWASVSAYSWGKPSIGHSDGRPWGENDDAPYARVTVHESESHDDGPAKVVTVGVKEMLVAIRKVISSDHKTFYSQGYSQTFRRRLLALLDQLDQGMPYDEAELDYDSDDADNMMQIAVFGEVIYS